MADRLKAAHNNPEALGITQPSQIKIAQPEKRVDYATIAGLFIAIGLIAAALLFGGNAMAFFNMPALLIVIGGTMAVTAISYSVQELSKAWQVINKSLFHKHVEGAVMARELLDIACVVRARGPLALVEASHEIRKNRALEQAVQFLVDDYPARDIQNILYQDINQLLDRHKIGIGILRRAADVAPAMGLIGTLVGLVQMLTRLSDPTTIGPAMAIALLTTFYGALLGTVILSPMAAKLERNSTQELMIRDMIMKAIVLISGKEHPRKIETFLNTLLPPGERIRYFD